MTFNESVFHKFPVLETKNLTLRKILLTDQKEVYSIRSSKEAMKYFGKHPYKSPAEALGFVYSEVNAFQNHEGIRWAICLKNSDKLIGSAGFWRIDRRHLRGEIGYELLPEFWKKGIMYEALSAIINFGFEKMHFHSIEANTDPLNTASMKLLERLGFVKEGLLKESFYFDGKFYDNVLYSLVKKD